MMQYFLKSFKIIATSPRLWIGILLPILFVASLGLVSLILIFVFGLRPQAEAFINLFPKSSGYDALSWIIAVILCLMESSVAVFLIQAVGLQKSSEKVFNFVYRQEHGHEHILDDTILSSLAPVTSWRLLKPTLIFISSMPINAIPIVGQVIFVSLNGYFQGPAMHNQYFKMRNWSGQDIDKFVSHHQSHYWLFGVIMTTLELIPILNVLNNYVGAGAAALLAIDLEKGL